ncbi:MAG TPA: peptidylprolyl isomerase [Alphaproteobacteria bacterium]|nr:peptidylprolyl isomerase [Alphaproteobacteria bacterium]
MADEKDVRESSNEFNEESNIDQINGLVSGDEDESEEAQPDEGLENVHEIEDDSQETEETNKEESDVEDQADAKENSEEKEEKETPVKKEKKPAPKKHKPIQNNSKKNGNDNSHAKAAPVSHKAKKVEQKPEPKKVQKVQAKPEIKKMEKSASKNGNGKNHKNGKSKSENGLSTKSLLIWIGIGVLALILVVALILVTKNNSPALVNTNETNTSVAATVNGEPIYMQDVLTQYNQLNPLMQQVYGIEFILNESIKNLLLYQEAKNIGLKVESEEIEAQLDNIQKTNMMSDEELEAALKAQGLTMEDVEEIIEKELLLDKLINTTILKDITITDEEIQSYYDKNAEQFKVAEKVTVQHILIMINESVNDAEAEAKAEQVNSELNATNFCQMVIKYSQDPGSLQTCGVYTFAKGDFNNPDFENPSFDLKVGEKTIVKTMFGYHIIKKLDTTPATVQKLSDVKQIINTTLRNEIAKERFDALLARLLSEAEIVNYVTKDKSVQTAAAETATMDDFAKCLTSKGAVFYGAYWCPHCENQKELFGDSIQHITYIECAVKDQPQVQTKECTDAEISGYPTWVINGLQYPGEQSIERLEQLTGCVAP